MTRGQTSFDLRLGKPTNLERLPPRRRPRTEADRRRRDAKGRGERLAGFFRRSSFDGRRRDGDDDRAVHDHHVPPRPRLHPHAKHDAAIDLPDVHVTDGTISRTGDDGNEYSGTS
jgi:hypothetical protein